MWHACMGTSVIPLKNYVHVCMELHVSAPHLLYMYMYMYITPHVSASLFPSPPIMRVE